MWHPVIPFIVVLDVFRGRNVSQPFLERDDMVQLMGLVTSLTLHCVEPNCKLG